MGNRTNLVAESSEAVFKPTLSKSVRKFSVGQKPVKPIFTKLQPKPQNIDDELSLDNISE